MDIAQLQQEAMAAAEAGRLRYLSSRFAEFLSSPILRSCALFMGNTGPNHEVVELVRGGWVHMAYRVDLAISAPDPFQLLKTVEDQRDDSWDLSDAKLAWMYGKVLAKAF